MSGISSSRSSSEELPKLVSRYFEVQPRRTTNLVELLRLQGNVEPNGNVSALSPYVPFYNLGIPVRP